MAWTERSRADPDRYEVTGWDIEMNGDVPHMATATVACSVGTSHRVSVRFKVLGDGTANVHELENVDNLSLDVLTAAIAVAEERATNIAGIARVDTVAERTARVKSRMDLPPTEA